MDKRASHKYCSTDPLWFSQYIIHECNIINKISIIVYLEEMMQTHQGQLVVEDILNHVIDDLEGFMRVLYEMAAARKELDKRTKKSARKKQNDRKQFRDQALGEKWVQMENTKINIHSSQPAMNRAQSPSSIPQFYFSWFSTRSMGQRAPPAPPPPPPPPGGAPPPPPPPPTSTRSLVGILSADSGKALYKMDRDDLRDICGTKESVRLFSHLQKDRAKAAKEAGSSDNQSELQDLNDMPQWKRELIKKQRRRRDDSDESPPERRRGQRKDNNKTRDYDSDDDHKDKRKSKHKGHRHHSDTEEEEEEENSQTKRRHRKGKRKGKEKKDQEESKGKSKNRKSFDKGKHKSSRSKVQDETLEKKGKSKSRDNKGRKKGPTNIDDYDESNSSNSDSYSDSDPSRSESESESSNEEPKRKCRALRQHLFLEHHGH
ncbi:sarcoplasmic reticulum histidine-rich calcium-binding protein-like [Gigantopelta aegis]|uniref:sarcoplasmic reticulum histidine-rich calcium-binding protein-like n=1 Tax=Gigantopelta aegis TaxID=1735272 RepID=UPI001B88A615|nr:sarcoplasmic reticulum histidine-rich calcium-binding protein-like [Gigantopelta aegis]